MKIMKRVISSLLVLCMLFAFASCSSDNGKTANSSTSANQDTLSEVVSTPSAQSPSGETPIVPVITKEEDLWYRNILLKPNQYDLYNELVDAVSYCKKQVVLSRGVTQEELDDIYLAVFLDHPEFFHIYQLEQNGAFFRNSKNDKLVYIYYQYEIDKIPSLVAQINDIVDDVIKEANKFTSDFDKETYLYYWIIDNADVNWPAHNEVPHSTIEEIFLQKRGVCIGFACALTYLCRRAGISAVIGIGRNKSDISHTWAVVTIDGDTHASDAYYGREKRVSIENSPAEFFNMKTYETLTNMQVTVYDELKGPDLGKSAA